MKVKKLFWTIKYLKPKQIFFRAYYLVKSQWFPLKDYSMPPLGGNSLKWSRNYFNPTSYIKNQSFTFLNQEFSFNNEIDWNYNGYGKLWTYNLNYFDFLNQENISLEEGISLIKDYIKKNSTLKDGKEPYPISLRGINWIKFISTYSIKDDEIDKILYSHYQILSNNLEYHLLGNHLLENGYSLFFGAYYFKDEKLYHKAKRILKMELNEQVLEDGGHFELSPMYHQILLHRLLDCIHLFQHNTWKNDGLDSFLKQKAVKMLSWLDAITFSNGNIPMVNDSAYGIAPTSQQLFRIAKNLGIEWVSSYLSSSGYRKYIQKKYELFVDVGNVGPSYQPGHAHSDTFSFELYILGKPIIVDTGTSTYEKNELRQKERATSSHNTVKVGNKDQTHVWGGFRVAKRAKIIKLEEDKNWVKAIHNGYRSIGVQHTRQFTAHDEVIIIRDEINKRTKETQLSFLHFHPKVRNFELSNNQVKLRDENVVISFEGAKEIMKRTYMFAEGFNIRKEAIEIQVSFHEKLTTKIEV